MWTLVNVKADLDELLGRKFFRLLGRELFKRDEKKQFALAQNLTMGEADINQFVRLRNQLVVAVRDFSNEENLPTVQVTLLAEDREEQLRLTHKVVEVVDRSHRKICLNMLRYNVEKPETSYVQVRLFGKRRDEEKFYQFINLFLLTINLMILLFYLM